MHTLKVSISVAILACLLATYAHSAVISDTPRVRRSSADQRIAELQALLALAGSRRQTGNAVAHGLFDPDVIGKKKRDPQLANMAEEERYNILKYLVQRAALENNSL